MMFSPIRAAKNPNENALFAIDKVMSMVYTVSRLQDNQRKSDECGIASTQSAAGLGYGLSPRV